MPNDAGGPARAASSDDVAGDAARPEHFATMRELSRRTRPVFETTPRFSPDGARLVYVSNVGGVRAVFVDALDGSPPRLVAPAPQRMRRPFVAPDGEHLLYTADEGGDEAYALFRMHLETGAIEAMTPGEKLRREGPWFTDDLSRFFFTARRHDETGAKLYEQSSELGAEPRLVFDDPALRFAGLRGDGARVLLLEATLGRELFVLDLPANAPPRRVFPHAGSDARVMSVAFSIAQPGAALVATDDGGEGSHVVAIDLESGAELARYTEARFPGARLRSLRVVADRVVFVVDAGVRHDVRVLDASTLEARPALDLPLGSEVPGATHPNMSDGLTVAPDARRLVVQWSTPTAPPHLLLVDLEAGTAVRLHEAATSAEPPRRGPRGDFAARTPRHPPSFVTEVVRVPSFDGLELPTLVHRVPGAAAAPVVVMLHGGFTLAATARWDPTVELFIEQGYAVVEPNVRGGGGFGRAFEAADDGVKKLDAARDVGAIGRWLRAQPWVDGARMALSGGSAGGYFTLLGLAFQPELWCAGVCMSGMFDLERTLRAQDGDLRAFLETELAPLDEPAILRALSPATYVDRVRAPLLVVAGDNDPRTPRADSDALVRALRASGSPVEYMRVSAQGHGFTDPRVRGELAARTLRLLREVFAVARG